MVMTVSTHHFEVPVIVVFTKYDQFLRNVEMHLADYPNEYPDRDLSEAAEKQFQEHYLCPLGDDVRFVQLESGLIDKFQDCMLMFVGRNAHAKESLC
jgi:hypothetical protein